MKRTAAVALLVLTACGQAAAPVAPTALEPTGDAGAVRSTTAVPCTMHIEVLSPPGPSVQLLAVYDAVTCGPQPPVWWAPSAQLFPYAQQTFRVWVSGAPGVHEVQVMEFADPGAGYDKIRITLTR